MSSTSNSKDLGLLRPWVASGGAGVGPLVKCPFLLLEGEVVGVGRVC